MKRIPQERHGTCVWCSEPLHRPPDGGTGWDAPGGDSGCANHPITDPEEGTGPHETMNDIRRIVTDYHMRAEAKHLSPANRKYLKEVFGYDDIRQIDRHTLEAIQENAVDGYLADQQIVRKWHRWNELPLDDSTWAKKPPHA